MLFKLIALNGSYNLLKCLCSLKMKRYDLLGEFFAKVIFKLYDIDIKRYQTPNFKIGAKRLIRMSKKRENSFDIEMVGARFFVNF